MIGIDWGTSSLRAYRLAGDGRILARRESAGGILHVPPGGFAGALREAVGEWLAAGETRVLMAGMVGSRQGWVEAPYLPCPAGAAELARALVAVPFEGAAVRLVPGLSGTDAAGTDAAGTPEVMRGEETQIISSAARGLACLPGSHAKWARVEAGRILSFRTYLSGEAFAALRAGTILGRMMTGEADDPDAFDAGLARAAEPGHLLHHLFGVRALGLFGRLPDTASAAYLSGLLIGHEVRAEAPAGQAVHLIGAPALCARYARAIAASGGTAVLEAADAAAAGLARIAELADWT
ncbi:MAG: 2-dehydro-3-deoxygalactonokinase [Rhodospirillales bacterium]|nr:2-dehydro-3-deoxygalactonokinase [Rhodospirillales bacterium]